MEAFDSVEALRLLILKSHDAIAILSGRKKPLPRDHASSGEAVQNMLLGRCVILRSRRTVLAREGTMAATKDPVSQARAWLRGMNPGPVHWTQDPSVAPEFLHIILR